MGENGIHIPLEVLEELFSKSTRRVYCLEGFGRKCGCGLIHHILYVCKYHKSMFKLKTLLN